MRQLALDVFTGADKVHGVVVVFINAGRHGEDIRVKNDIFRRETDLFRQDFISAAADLDFTRSRIRLSDLVKGHHHYRRAVTPHQPGVMNKGFYALFH